MPLDFQRIPLDSKVTTLILSSTEVKSLDGIRFARNLRTLDLSNNFIAGTLPDDFFYLVELKSLHLSANALSGTLPSHIGNLMKLVNFYADGNDFSGTIPSELGRLWILENLGTCDTRILPVFDRIFVVTPLLTTRYSALRQPIFWVHTVRAWFPI